ncbi:Copia protein [Eumeta japonica]|uniref:Copia protein n=1 Tax=Eumeta variegata TaxID=151549 RepID=A0A4C1VKD5_EUMVA|nr:Copia protein [Eumeta japonica]
MKVKTLLDRPTAAALPAPLVSTPRPRSAVAAATNERRTCVAQKAHGDRTLQQLENTYSQVLTIQKCKDVIMRAKTRADDATWDDRDIQATNYIYSAITNRQLEYISELETAYEIIQKVSLFFDDFEKCVNELKQAGAVITEQEKLNYMLKSLPQNYSHIGDLIDVLPEKDRTVDYLKSKIKLKKAEEESNETSHDSSNAFRAETKTASHTKCYNCGKPGHFQKDCHTRTVHTQRGRGRGYFGSRGRGYSVSRGRDTYNTRNFRGRGNHNNERPRTDHYEQYGNSFHTTIVNNTTTNEKDKTKKREIEWLLDSGCTDHIINTDEYFESCETLKKPVKVKIGDGRILEARKVGNIKANFLVYGENQK